MKKFLALFLTLILLALFLASFVLGRYDVPIGQVVRILLSRVIPLTQTWTGNMEIAVLNVRLPRILLACLVGCSLSAAGTAYQSVFRNPMAAPDILGASSGACFGAALAILLGFQRLGVTAAAFAASLATVALVYVLARGIRGNQVVNLLLAGIMISSLFSAGTSYIKLVADPTNQLPAITYWLMGSLSGTRMKDVTFALLPMALGAVPLLLLRWRVNLLTLSEEEARALMLMQLMSIGKGYSAVSLEMLEQITAGNGTVELLREMEELCYYIKANSLCALGQSAPNPVLSTLHYFRDEYEAHCIEKRCPAGVCKRLVRFVIEEDKCKGCTACARACPVNAISGEVRKPHQIDTRKCIKCGACKDNCAFDAIYVEA